MEPNQLLSWLVSTLKSFFDGEIDTKNVVSKLSHLLGYTVLLIFALAIVNFVFYWTIPLNKLIGPQAIEIYFRQKGIVEAARPVTEKVIPRWKLYNPDINKNNVVTSETATLKKNVEEILAKLSGFGHTDLSAEIFVYYYYHLAYLHIIHADLTNENTDFYVAENYLSRAKEKIKANKQDQDFMKYITDGNYEKDINWLLLNTKAFQLSRVHRNSISEKKVSLEVDALLSEVQGCGFLDTIPLRHRELKETLCP